MILASMVRSQPLFWLSFLQISTIRVPNFQDLLLLLVGGVCAFLLSYGLTFAVIAVCRKLGLFDRPEPGRTQKKVIPRLGGIGIFLAFVVASLLIYTHDPQIYVLNAGKLTTEANMYWLFLAASTLIVAVHVYDDIKPLKPLIKLLVQTLAVLVMLGPFGRIFYGVLLFGFSNPFSSGASHPGQPWFRVPELSLFIHQPYITLAAIPAVLLTWCWMVGMMNTVNLIDGIDGLATGVVGITAFFIAIISWTLHQDTIAILAAIFTGAVLGFLPHNWNPAKIIMGDSGSQFLGLGLAVLSIMGGAKVALAFMVLGIPILDVAVVAINRIRRGQSPLHYDTTHLHHRLRATGLSVKQICYVFYGFTITFGVLALWFVRIYKFLGLALVGLTMAAVIFWIDYQQRQRGTPIKLDNSEPGSGGNGAQPVDVVPDTPELQEVKEYGPTPLPPDSTDVHSHSARSNAQLPL